MSAHVNGRAKEARLQREQNEADTQGRGTMRTSMSQERALRVISDPSDLPDSGSNPS